MTIYNAMYTEAENERYHEILDVQVPIHVNREDNAQILKFVPVMSLSNPARDMQLNGELYGCYATEDGRIMAWDGYSDAGVETGAVI